ncbi:glucosaminidase domain-containing protein [Candidatus Pelagibacter sp.]|nr:glucosaminidase domain-containing protein [Candidatus Pelagibacter sp.]
MVRRTKNKNIKQFKKKNNIFRFSAISLLVIFSFFTLPTIKIFLDKNLNFNKSVISNAGINFDQELEKRKKILDGQTETRSKNLSLKNIFADIDFFSTDEEGQNSIRFDARTIEQLFKDTNYNLERVRDTKLVNIGNKIDHLPIEIKSIESSKKRKRLFIQIVLPLIVEENAKIRLDRKKLFRILSKNINTQKEKSWLKEKFKQYGLQDGDFYSLKVRMDEIPVSLALAQAAKETGWGTSRFALEGNALFGQWTWNGEGIRPAGVDKEAKHKVAKFAVLKASVRAYQRNLNTHSSYIEFRKERAIQRDNDERLDSLKLVNYLDKYAETGQQYIDVLKKIIKQNSLKDFDDVNVMPTSNKTKKLI